MADQEISRFPRGVRARMPGSTTTPGRPDARAGASEHVAFRYTDSVGAPGFVFYRGSMAGLPVPLPTLRRRPHGRLRTAGADVVCYSFIVEDLHLLRVKTQRRANCREKYSFESPLRERGEHTELQRRRIREANSLPFARFLVFTQPGSFASQPSPAKTQQWSLFPESGHDFKAFLHPRQGRPPLQPKDTTMQDNANFCCPPPGGYPNKIESTVRYLGIEVDDALSIAEQVDL